MKSFKSHIKEGLGVGTTDQMLNVDADINPSAISNPKVIRALNAYVGAIANMEYILPEHALNKLRNSLSRVGFSFGSIP